MAKVRGKKRTGQTGKGVYDEKEAHRLLFLEIYTMVQERLLDQERRRQIWDYAL
jgi:hypothetical protein